MKNRLFNHRFLMALPGLFLLLTIAIAPVLAQSRITGKITAAKDNAPVPGVNVLVKGSTTGSVSDASGNYSISAEPNTTLTFSSVGYAAQDVNVGGRTVINVTLAESTANLDEVVVTALGIKRASKSLGYATATVNTEQLTTVRTVNLGSNLQGKIPGVNVSPSATGPAGTAKIRIRGQSSFKGDNSPLIIVNGIPINNSSFSSRRGDSEGQTTRAENFSDGGDGLLSINPDDIENMTVLKGATAAALYGFRAKDGAIIITTKSGTKREGIGVELSSNFTIDDVVDETDFQYEYGQGENGVRPIDLASAQSTGIFSFGEKLDGKPTIQYDGVSRPYLPAKNHIRDFYETGRTWSNTVSLSGGSEKGGFHLSFSNVENKGIVPNSAFNRKSINLGLNYNLTSKLSVSSNINYSNEVIKNPAQVGIQAMNANAAIYTFANSIELSTLRNAIKDANGNEIATSRFTPRNNPYWSTLERFENAQRDRIFGNLSLRYNLLSWLYVQGRVGMDYYARNNDYNGPTGSRHFGSVPTGFNGFYYQEVRKFRETNLDFLVGANRTFGSIGVDLTLGGNQLYQKGDNNNVLVNNFFIRDLYTVMNGQIKDPQYFFSEKKVNSLYAALGLSYKDYLFLNVTGRNDWFSTLNPESNSYLYPSVSGSFVFSQAAQLPSWLSYGKLRGAYAEVGGDTDPYQNNLYYGLQANTLNNIPLGSINTGVSPNTNLRPLKVKELEFGLELRFLQNRLGIDVAVYRKNTVDEILNVQISNASGYDFTKVNVGKLRNEGIELLLNGTVLQGKALGWESSLNLALNRSEVIELANGQTSLTVATQPDFAGIISHVVGQPMASLQGRGYARNESGQRIFLANGRPAFDNTIRTWGSAVPTYWGGWTNTFTFKGIRVSGLIDFKGGNKLISSTNYNLWRHGLHKGSLPGRSDGGVLGEGVKADGSPNTTRVVNAQLFYGDIRNIAHFVEEFVYDASFIKLRQLSVGYDFTKLIKKGPVRGLTLSAVCNNVAVLQKHTPNIDPEQIGGASDNLAGIESGALPLTRSIGFNLNVKF